jgi:hypothetical protein
MTFKDNTSLESLYFNVENLNSNEFLTRNFTEGKERTIYIPEKDKVVHLCSEDYTLIPNEQLFEPIRAELTRRYGETGFEVNARNIDDRKFYVKFTIKTIQENVQVGDIISPSLEIRNSYDGSLSFGISVGYHRLICTNGLMAFSEAISLNKKHRNIEVIPSQLLKFLEQVDIPMARFKKLTDRRLTSKELDELRESIRKRTQFPKRLIGASEGVLLREQNLLSSEVTGWLAYNAYNNLLNHADIRCIRSFGKELI